MSDLIQPKVLKGFRDFLPDAEIERALLIETLTRIFRESGFVPIDTPALEYTDILLRKSDGETEKQIFRFTDNGGRDVALRFDLTVPFARFTAEHHHALYLPFKRYHIAKVWRGEKPQAGRYREFVQCDFDSIGSDSAAADFEIVLLILKSMDALGAPRSHVHISHRGIFNRLLARLSIQDKSEAVLRLVDKRAKIGDEALTAELHSLVGKDAAEVIVSFIEGGIQGKPNTPKDYTAVLEHITELAGGEDEDTRRLKKIGNLLAAVGRSDRVVLNPSITRGLDYYTGVVYETFLTDLPQIGSVCSGGRYDNLTGMYMKQSVSGVGSSVGLDRLLAAFRELGIKNTQTGFIRFLFFHGSESKVEHLYAAAEALQTLGLPSEVYPEPKKMAQQYRYAEQKQIRYGIFLDAFSDQDIGETVLRIKNLSDRSEQVRRIKDMAAHRTEYTAD